MPTKTLTKTEEPWIGSFTPWDDKNPPPSFAREEPTDLTDQTDRTDLSLLPTPEAVAAVPQTGPGGGRSYEGFLYEQLLTLTGGGGFQVTLTTPATGDTLIYNSSNSTFENKAPSATPFLPIAGGTMTGELTIVRTDAATNTVTDLADLSHDTSSTAAAGFGSRILLRLQDTTTPDVEAADLTTTWATATHASRKARAVFHVWGTAVAEVWRGEATVGNAPAIGFLGAGASIRQPNASQAAITAVTDANAKSSLQAIYNLLFQFGLADATA